MAGLDLDALGATTENDTTPVVWPETQEGSPEVPDDSIWINLERLGVNVEAHEDQDELRRSIDGEQAMQDFSPEELSAIERFFEQFAPDINSIIFDIESDISAAAEMSEAELITEMGSITLTWEFAELWSEIVSEVARIHGLADGEEISIESDEWIIEFNNKQEALLYLYALKISIFRVQEFLNSIWENNESNFGLYFSIIKWALIWVVWSSTLGSMARRFNSFTLRISNGRVITWNYISVASSWSEWNEAIWTWEIQKRREAAQLLDYVFLWNGNIDSSQLPDMNVLDHRVFVDGNNIGGPFWEWTWWRELKHLSHWRNTFSAARMTDFFLKPWLFNSEWRTTQYLMARAEIKNSVLRQLFETTPTEMWEHIRYTRLDITPGSESPMVQNFRDFIELSHEVSNQEEARIRDDMNTFMRSMENWNLDFINDASNTESALREVQHRMVEIATWNRWSTADIARIFWDGNYQNPGESMRLRQLEVRPGLITLNNYDEIIAARNISASLQWIDYDERQVRLELQEFFESIGDEPWKNRYNFKTASLIIEWILEWENQEAATSRVFEIPWDNVNSLVGERNYLWTLNNNYIRALEVEIVSRAENIWSLEELRNFERQVMDRLVGYDGTPSNSLWERVVRQINAILEQKRNAWLPDTRATPTPEPVEWDANAERYPHYHPDVIDAELRAQAVFDETGRMTEDARLLFQSNVQAYILNGWEFTLDEIESTERECRANCENIWDMLRELTVLNEENTITDIHNAQAVVVQAQRYSAQDILERSLLQSNSFSEQTNIRVDIRDARIIASVTENGILTYDFDATSLDNLESQIRTNLSITWDIVDWDGINLESYRGRGIDIERFWEYKVLHSIDRFFRRAR